MTEKILIIGGGIRLKKAGEAFNSLGYPVSFYDGSAPLKSAIDSADIILLGIPVSKDGVNLTQEENEAPISLRDIAALAGRNKLVAGGRMSERVKALFDIYSVKWLDYALCEEFEVLNAVPTAEGAIQIAMEEFPFTIHSSNTIVTGFGKVSRALCLRLKALGANCTVVARNSVQRAEAESMGFEAIDYPLLPQKVKACHILFNTVPAKVIGKSVLSNMHSEQGIIDLASKPGGVDLDAATAFGVNVIWALSLPGKVAPKTAGEIIQKTVCNVIDDFSH